MGSFTLTLSVLVISCYVAQALKCYHCPFNTTCDPPEVMECGYLETWCIRIAIHSMNVGGTIQRCAKEAECSGEKHLPQLVEKHCCDTDLCN
ncbi:hypothetical protein AGOR_G00096170 [Albula goreensis]|uniref:Snake toxin/toxin-like domain-containing protein n=1 Tax=Albula goreensis TaxID=1534307 RepID=A0A8T3DL47_9TELE|nr:hypothetical protein AGOR_G00096170 [Albula goreensis]